MASSPGALSARHGSPNIPNQNYQASMVKIETLRQAFVELAGRRRRPHRPHRAVEVANETAMTDAEDLIIISELQAVMDAMETASVGIDDLIKECLESIDAVGKLPAGSNGHQVIISDVVALMRKFPELAMDMESELLSTGKQSRAKRAQDLTDVLEKYEAVQVGIDQLVEYLNRFDIKCSADATTIREQYGKIAAIEERENNLLEENDDLLKQIVNLKGQIKVYKQTTAPPSGNRGHEDMKVILEAIAAIPRSEPIVQQQDPEELLRQYQQEQVQGRVVEGMETFFQTNVSFLKKQIAENAPTEDEEDFPLNWVDVWNVFTLGTLHQRDISSAKLKKRESKVNELEQQLKDKADEYARLQSISEEIAGDREREKQEIKQLKDQIETFTKEQAKHELYVANSKARYGQMQAANKALEKEKVDLEKRLTAAESDVVPEYEKKLLQQELTHKGSQIKNLNDQVQTWFDQLQKANSRVQELERVNRNLQHQQGRDQLELQGNNATKTGLEGQIKLLQALLDVEKDHVEVEKARVVESKKQLAEAIADWDKKKRELQDVHRDELQLQIKKTEDAMEETKSNITIWKSKRDAERQTRVEAENQVSDLFKQINTLNQQLANSEQDALKALALVGEKTAKMVGLGNNLAAKEIEIQNLTKDLATERSIVRDTSTEAASSKAIADRQDERIKGLEEKLKEEASTFKIKSDDMSKEIASVKDMLDHWREAILLDVFGIENWSTIDLDEKYLQEVMSRPLISLPTRLNIQRAAKRILAAHDTGKPPIASSMSASLALFRMWIISSKKDSELGLQAIQELAVALDSSQYMPRTLTFLEATLSKMMNKNWTTDEAFFCLYGFELLINAGGVAGLSVQKLFANIKVEQLPDDPIVLGHHRYLSQHLLGPTDRETRGASMMTKCTGFKFSEDCIILPYDRQILAVSSSSNSIILRPLEDLRVVANLLTGKYMVYMESLNSEEWKYSGDMSDGFGGVFDLFPKANFSFDP